MNSKAWAVTAALVATSAAQATCYSVHRADGTLILETSTAPVNLTMPLGDTVPDKFGPGTFMTMSDLGVFCKQRRGAPAAQKVAAAAAPVKKHAEVKAQAPIEHQPSDEEFLALKPEEVAAVTPVQAVDVTREQPPQGNFDGEKEEHQIDAREATRKVGAQQE
ncbi:hypothetical protein [Ramlibacter alkalitolerans]|uniref:Uncharacterized protein n=1 Tax=Ramlibacter alkalitolerans TaxID=2039631 RepID=A0ABS1JN00_9BURK|nr:hypothetical protein [Ramlibacter alkalitolerans]MBL0425623.1 hypothetical protein [Ramlibacter alkalitolerans]